MAVTAYRLPGCVGPALVRDSATGKLVDVVATGSVVHDPHPSIHAEPWIRCEPLAEAGAGAVAPPAPAPPRPRKKRR